MTALDDTHSLIQDLNGFNSDDHRHFGPTDLVEYARQAGVSILLSNWETAILNGHTTLGDLFHDIDEVVDDMNEIKKIITTDNEHNRRMNTDRHPPENLAGYARQAAMEVLIQNWEAAAKVEPGLDIRTMKADIDYTRADLLKMRAVLQAEYRDVLNVEIEPRARMSM